MTYTEIKKKGEKTYYYRGKSIRQGKKVNKERIYLGVNLTKQELDKKEQEADKKMDNTQEKPKEKELKEKPRKQGESKQMHNVKGISVKKQEDMASWYEQVCLKAEIADFGPVKGTIIIRPNGYSIWQSIQDYFNENIIKATGVRNAYFPLFIPESFFKKEAEHAEGFNPEVAWIDKEVSGEGERIAIRPTSETIMYDAYSQWIRSYKDLPLKINQWANVVRWETETTKLFIRSREFLWQEGHCVYETEEECKVDTINYIKLYAKLCEELLSIHVIVGKKTEKERFAGAKETYTIEAFMPDGKALQCGTSHELGQGFAKSFNISFLGKDKEAHTPWQNSWGLSTRLIGGLIMIHSDDKGLVLPPKIAENKIVIIPILIGKSDNILKKAKELKKILVNFNPLLDDRTDQTPGYKFNEWEMKGTPLRIELGPRDLEKNKVVVARRDTGNKQDVYIKDLEKEIPKILDKIQKNLLIKSKKDLEDSIIIAKTWNEFEQGIKNKKLVQANFCGETKCEDWIKEKSGGATSRCIPFDKKPEKNTKCVLCEKPAKHLIYFSKSY